MQLTENFSLEEFLVSQTAERHGIDMDPPDHVIENLIELCETILQPLREEINTPITINSGYRPRKLNTLIGGSKTSQHCFGRAADLMAVGMTPYAVCEKIQNMDVNFDQVIHEFGKWTHVGTSKHPRNQVLTAARVDGVTTYLPGLLRMEEI